MTTTATGSSFVVLLSQGILGNDEEKIESVLQNSDPSTIFATVKDLPRVSHLDKLISLNGKLEMITEQMERRAQPTFFAQQQPLFILNDDDKIDSDAEEVLFEYPDEDNEEWWGSDDNEEKSDAEMEVDNNSEEEQANGIVIDEED
uniref:Uncharacterized protein n=1 Tax=Panagrolaimus sp. JU765 TaxID=591449 RepID=A0AC34PW16_9BILA